MRCRAAQTRNTASTPASAGVNRIRLREIPDDDLDAVCEHRGRRATHERTHRSSESKELADDGPADAAGGADDQDGGSIGNRHAA